MARKTMTPAERFFFDYGGYSYGPDETRGQGRRRGAEESARAEEWAASVALSYSWEWDDVQDLSDHEVWCSADCGKDHEVAMVTARYRDGSLAAILGGIIDPDARYRRAVEADLAAEARADVLASVFEAI